MRKSESDSKYCGESLESEAFPSKTCKNHKKKLYKSFTVWFPKELTDRNWWEYVPKLGHLQKSNLSMN